MRKSITKHAIDIILGFELLDDSCKWHDETHCNSSLFSRHLTLLDLV